MTVENQTNKVTANGNDSATVFSFSPMVINAAAELIVTHVSTTSVETNVPLGTGSTDFSQNITSFPATGSVTYPATGGTPLATGEKLVIKRVLTLEQQTDLQNQGGYFPEVQETAFDKLVMIALQQQETIDRCFKLAVSVVGSFDPELPANIAAQAGLAVVVNSAGDGLTLSAITTTAVDAFWVSILTDATLAASLASMGFASFMQSFLLDTTAAAALAELGGASLGPNTFTGTQKWDKGADVGSTAGVMTLGADGNHFTITGTNAITGITTIAPGTVVILEATGAWSMVHSSTFLMSGAATITAAAGDVFVLVETETAGTWRMVSAALASGLAVVVDVPPLSLSDWQGLSLAIGTDTAHEFTISAGKCRDAADTKNCELSAAITDKDFDLDFAEGGSAGGMATSISLPTSGTVHFFIAEKDSAQGTFDIIGDTSVTMANGVTGWTMRRRIGSRRTDGSDNFVATVQRGNIVELTLISTDIAAANPGTDAVTAVLGSIPSGVVMEASLIFSVRDANLASVSGGAILTALTQTDVSPTTALYDLIPPGVTTANQTSGSIQKTVFTDTSNSVRYHITTSDAGITVHIITHGWVDRRGRGE